MNNPRTPKARILMEQMEADPNHPKHGTPAGYVYYGCRCDKCRGWSSAVRQDSRNYWRNHPERIHPSEHGRIETYTNKLCRCMPCTEAARKVSMAYRASKKANR